MSGPKPFLDKNGDVLEGSISEKVHAHINGLEQGMFIQSRDATNPVLLFLHGGPGTPEYILTKKYPTGLEDHFTVVWWEQRGSGLSYRADIPPETMTAEHLISDTLEVTDYLRDRFGRKKIYLLGHSAGSFYGIQAAARSPGSFHAYIGVSQLSYQLRSEMLAYEYMLEQFRNIGNTEMVRKLELLPPPMTVPLPRSYLALRNRAMRDTWPRHDPGQEYSKSTSVLIPYLLSNDYTWREKVNIWRGESFSSSALRDEMFATDLTEKVPGLELPVYFCHGLYDHIVSYAGTRSYFDGLRAPMKGFYTFGSSAHSPMFEEPERMRRDPAGGRAGRRERSR